MKLKSVCLFFIVIFLDLLCLVSPTIAESFDLNEEYLRMVTLVEEKFMDFGVNWKSLGKDKLTTDAGVFECFKLRIGPSSVFVRLVAPSGISWFDSSGTHKIVRFQGKQKRFDKERITDLVEYRCTNPTQFSK